MEDGNGAVVSERIESRILLLRGLRVMLAEDLAALYEVEVRALNQAVARNVERFPADFMFQLTGDEVADLRSQIVALNSEKNAAALKSQSVISNSGEDNPHPGRGGRRYLPYAFTEQGVAMLSSVLRSPRAVQGGLRRHPCLDGSAGCKEETDGRVWSPGTELGRGAVSPIP